MSFQTPTVRSCSGLYLQESGYRRVFVEASPRTRLLDFRKNYHPFLKKKKKLAHEARSRTLQTLEKGGYKDKGQGLEAR